MGYTQHLNRRQELGVLGTTSACLALPLLCVIWPRIPRSALGFLWILLHFGWLCWPAVTIVGNIIVAGLLLLAFVPHWRRRRRGLIDEMEPTGDDMLPASETRSIIKNGRIVFFDYFRACVMLMIVIAIWGIDFRFFPRKHHKSLTTGLSLMDVGTGCIIYTGGVVAARPGAFKRGFPFLPFFVLLALGSTRLIYMKLAGLPFAVTEYGQHWNFYFTLGFNLVTFYIALKIFKGWVWIPTIVMGLAYEILLIAPIMSLQHTLEEYSFDISGQLNKRGNLFTANVEGIMSTLGYTTVAMAAYGVGRFYYSDRSNNGKKLVLLQTTILAVLFYLSLTRMGAVVGLFDPQLGQVLTDRFEPSRRVANLTYVLFIFCLQNFHSLILLAIQTTFGMATPRLIRLVSDHQLVVFVVANVFVGAGNTTFDPYFVPSWAGIPIVLVYVVASCYSPLALQGVKRMSAWAYHMCCRCGFATMKRRMRSNPPREQPEISMRDFKPHVVEVSYSETATEA